MTLGERIAQKRKELGLSQEALGEKLGVSRQAIYKWESDATLPEVEKLVALSGLFGVSVGWLLGTEEGETAGGELTEIQLKMVEEIVGRYLPARSRRGRRWLAVGAVALCLLVGNLYLRLGDLTRQSKNLQYAVNQVETSVNRQVGGISDRVEEILKSQNDLTTDYGVELASVDLKANTITFDLHALPRTYVPGMEALFLVNCGEGGPLEFPAQRGEDGVYRAQAAIPLTDDQAFSAVFVSSDGTRATQAMQTRTYTLRETLPTIFLHDSLRCNWSGSTKEAVNMVGSSISWEIWLPGSSLAGEAPAQAEQVKVGLFKNGELLFWAEESEFSAPEGDVKNLYFPSIRFPAAEEDRFTVAAIIKDSYGRVFSQKGNTYQVDLKGRDFSWVDETDTAGTDPLTWDYPKDGDGWPTE